MVLRTRSFGWLAMLLALLLLAAAPARPSPEEDQGILAGMLQDLLSDAGRDVRIRGFEGALSSRATIREITIADAQGVWITLHDVVLDWNRAALLERRVEVNELSARRITRRARAVCLGLCRLTRSMKTGASSALSSSLTRIGLPSLAALRPEGVVVVVWPIRVVGAI